MNETTNSVGVDVIISRLRDGYTLENRGSGWWLTEPREAYKRAESCMVADSVVDAMERDKLITVEIPYLAAKAVLRG